MKLINTLLKLFAIFLIILFIIFFPISLTLKSISSVLFSPERISNVISENIINVEFISQVIEGSLTSEIDILDEASPFTLIQKSLTHLDSNQISKMVTLIFPQETINQMVSEFTNNLYDVLVYGESEDLTLDLRSVKQNILNSDLEFVEILFSTLPLCSSDQMSEIVSSLIEGMDNLSLPTCMPPEPMYSTILIGIIGELPNILQKMPDEYSVPLNLFGSQLPFSVQRIRQAIWLFTNLWKIGLITLVMAVIFGARSFKKIFQWGGTPLVITGMFTLLIGSLSKFVINNIQNTLLNDLVSQIGESAGESILQVVVSMVSEVFDPLIWQGVLQGIVGVSALGIAIILGMLFKRSNNNLEESQINNAQLANQNPNIPENTDGDSSGTLE